MAVKRNAGKQILTALLATMPTFTYGIKLGWLSPMKKLLFSAEKPIPDTTISWLAAAFPLAAMTAIPAYSYCSDTVGRKWTIVIISVLDCISWTVKLAPITPTSLIIARVIAGLAASGCFVVIPVYIKEIAEDSLRGSLSSMTMTLSTLGVIFVYAVGMMLSYEGNQAVYLSVSAVHVLAFSFMPESPNFAVKVGKEKEAAETIAWLRNLQSSDDVVMEEIKKLKEDQSRSNEMPKVTIASVVRDKATFSALRMVLVLMVMQTLSGCFALLNFASGVFSRAGAQWSPDVLALFMGALQLAGSFTTTVTVDRLGRKIPLALSSLIVSVCMTTIATYFLLDNPENTNSWLCVAAVCTALMAYGAGLAPVPMVVMAEVFTFQVRARMAGVCMALSFFCSSMTVLFYEPISRAFGEYVVFYIFASVTLLGFFYTILCVPDTKGKSLEEIRKFWQKKEPVVLCQKL